MNFRRNAHMAGPLAPDELRRLRACRDEGLSWDCCRVRFGRSIPFLKDALAGVEHRSPPGRVATELTPAQVVTLGQAVAGGGVSRVRGTQSQRQPKSAAKGAHAWGEPVSQTVAALFVERGGAYWGLEGVDAWDEARDARLYAGPHPCVAHPPCQRWGRYWSGGPSAKVRRTKGDDGGCFASALASVRRWGGVLEHPEASHAWAAFGLRRPIPGRWVESGEGGWTCQVEQGHYGHPARKKTWLYVFRPFPVAWVPLDFIWGPSTGIRLDEGFHSSAERKAARAAGMPPRKRLTTAENLATPPQFRDVLLSIARGSL